MKTDFLKNSKASLRVGNGSPCPRRQGAGSKWAENNDPSRGPFVIELTLDLLLSMTRLERVLWRKRVRDREEAADTARRQSTSPDAERADSESNNVNICSLILGWKDLGTRELARHAAPIACVSTANAQAAGPWCHGIFSRIKSHVTKLCCYSRYVSH